MATPSHLDRDLGRVEGKVDSILVSMSELKVLINDRDAAQTARTKELEDRVSALEKNLYRFTGAAALVGTTIGWVLPHFLKYILK